MKLNRNRLIEAIAEIRLNECTIQDLTTFYLESVSESLEQEGDADLEVYADDCGLDVEDFMEKE